MATIKSLFSTLLDAYTKNKELLSVANNAGAHNGIYRGIDLTTKYTEAQISAKIQAGDFSDLYIGDYIPKTLTIDGTSVTSNWTIAHFNYYNRIGWTADGLATGFEVNMPHVVLVPNNVLYYKGMNASNTTSGGYVGSRMHTEDMPKVATALKNAFGSTHVIPFASYISTTVSTSVASKSGGGLTGGVSPWGCAWTKCECRLMSESMVYGGQVHESSGWDAGEAKSRFALFTLNPESVSIRLDWWLSGVASSAYFCLVNFHGNASAYDASIALGVRPFFLYH